MDPHPPALSLLEELDRRQDEVLAELEALDERLTALLAEHNAASSATTPALGASIALEKKQAA